MRNNLLRQLTLFMFLSATSMHLIGQEDSKDVQSDDQETQQAFIERQLLKYCPVEDGWTRVSEVPLVLGTDTLGGSYGGITVFKESEKSLWIYHPLVDRPYTKENVDGMRLSAFGLDKNNKVVQAKTYKAVRWASNKTPTSLTLLEFQINLSELKMLPIEILFREFKDPSKEEGVLLFLERRNESFSRERIKAKDSSQDENKKQAVKVIDEEKLLEAETNTLVQHPDTLWLVPPKPVRNFDSAIFTSNRDFVSHFVIRRVGKQVQCMAFGLDSDSMRNFPEIIVAGPSGKALQSRGGAASTMSVGHKGKTTTIISVRSQYEDLPKYGAVGVADGRSQ